MAASNDDNCIFCKILKSEAPYESVYEVNFDMKGGGGVSVTFAIIKPIKTNRNVSLLIG